MKGLVEFHDFRVISGWARNPAENGLPPTIVVECDDEEIERVQADRRRLDLQREPCTRGSFGFVFPIPTRLLDGQRHTLRLRLASGEELSNSPVRLELKAEQQQIPYVLTDPTGGRALVLAPHPDDESLGCGGTIALHRRAGDAVRVVFLTDGAEGRASDSRISRPELIARRRGEALEACSVLGVEESDFWDFPDRGLSAASALVGRLSTVISEWRPEVVYSPSPHDFHPDHRAAAAAVWGCIQNLGVCCLLRFYEINPPMYPDTLVNVTPTIDTKRQACLCYQSQLEQLPYWEIAEGLNRYRSLTVADQARYVEAFQEYNSEFVLTHPVESLQPGTPLRIAAEPGSEGPSRGLELSPASGEAQSLEPTQPEGASALVSMLIRTFNRPRLLVEALRSAAAQRYANLEVIVVNDGGVDVSEVVAPFRGQLRLKLIQLQERKGPAAAGNQGFAKAEGDFFCLLDDDDILYPDHVGCLMEQLSKETEFVYSDCLRARYAWTERGYCPVSEKRVFGGRDFDLRQLRINNCIPAMTAMFSRRLWEKSGGFRDLGMFEDWDLWLRMSRHTQFRHLRRVTAEYRLDQKKPSDSRYWRKRIYRRHNFPLYLRFTLGDIHHRLRNAIQ